MEKLQTKVKIILEDTTLPEQMTPGSAGFDVRCNCDYILMPGRNRVPTGIRQQFSPNVVCMVDPRGGFSKNGLEAYSVGDKNFEHPIRINADVIHGTGDADYTGEYGVFIYSNEKIPHIIRKGTRICQFVYVPVVIPQFEEVDSLIKTERGEGAYGHTKTL